MGTDLVHTSNIRHHASGKQYSHAMALLHAKRGNSSNKTEFNFKHSYHHSLDQFVQEGKGKDEA